MHDKKFNEVGQKAWDYALNGQSDELDSLMRQHCNMRPEEWIHPQHRSSPLHAACYSTSHTTGCVRVLAQAVGRRYKTLRDFEAHEKHVLNLPWPANGNHIEEGVSADGATPLFVACCRDKEDAVEILLQSSADPNIANSQGLTPLHRFRFARESRTRRA